MQSYRRFRLRTGTRGRRGYERVCRCVSIHYALLDQVCAVALRQQLAGSRVRALSRHLSKQYGKINDMLDPVTN